MTLANSRVLVLNAGYLPHAVTALDKAFCKLASGAAEVVESNGVIGTVHGQIPLPTVIRLKRYHNVPKRNVKWSRKGVLQRDNYTCVYCGRKGKDDAAKRPESVTVDHLVPQSVCEVRGIDPNTWTNTVTSCKRCNQKKRNRNPQEANMRFHNPDYIARAPRSRWTLVASGNIPEEWKLYLQSNEGEWK